MPSKKNSKPKATPKTSASSPKLNVNRATKQKILMTVVVLLVALTAGLFVYRSQAAAGDIKRSAPQMNGGVCVYVNTGKSYKCIERTLVRPVSVTIPVYSGSNGSAKKVCINGRDARNVINKIHASLSIRNGVNRGYDDGVNVRSGWVQSWSFGLPSGTSYVTLKFAGTKSGGSDSLARIRDVVIRNTSKAGCQP